jgi:hypothetical protein
MPYIDKGQRAELEPVLDEFRATLLRLTITQGKIQLSEGELNYLISSIVNEVWKNDPKYHSIARITGVLENVKQEFYRRVAEPYEDEKIDQNGDIYG